MKKVFRARRFDVEEVYQDLGEGRVLARHIVRHPGAVVILPLVDSEHICLIRTFRVAVDRWLIELPAGTLDKGLSPSDKAKLELAEETGFQATQFSHIHTFRMSPGILDEQMHFFVAEGLTAADPDRELGEEIDNMVVSWSQVDRLLRDGLIEDAKTLVALLWYMRYRKYA